MLALLRSSGTGGRGKLENNIYNLKIQDNLIYKYDRTSRNGHIYMPGSTLIAGDIKVNLKVSWSEFSLFDQICEYYKLLLHQ